MDLGYFPPVTSSFITATWDPNSPFSFKLHLKVSWFGDNNILVREAQPGEPGRLGSSPPSHHLPAVRLRGSYLTSPSPGSLTYKHE